MSTLRPSPFTHSPLLVIVGETASGKTALAIDLAEQFNGEIICADSRTVYIGMDIGTAKPTREEQDRVRHHLIDIVRPNERFTAADFKRLANEAITDIADRGKLPIMVGGTGLYIDSVIYDYQFNAQKRERDPQNPRHLLKDESSVWAHELRNDTLMIGLRVDREVLMKRVTDRVEAMVKSGFIDEIKVIVAHYTWGVAPLQAPGYRAFREYLEGSANLDEAKQQFVKNDLNLAKRQRTWFKRNKSIQWFNARQEQSNIVDIVTTFLNKTR